MLSQLISSAQQHRPEYGEVHAMQLAAQAELRAARAQREQPTLSAMLFYYPPTTPMPEHRWGVGLSSTLPWLWGEGPALVSAAESKALEAEQRQAAVGARIRGQLATATAEVKRATSLLEVLQARVLPATRRAEQSAAAGYASGRGALLDWMMARTAVAQTELQQVEARAKVEHVLVELRFAAGMGTEQGNGP
jgi:outer membrane protein TolC